MLYKTYKSIFIEELSFLYDLGEAESFFYIILEKLHNLKRIDLALNPNLTLNDVDLEKLKAMVTELKTHKPIQYILGETQFYDLSFLVNEHTLIPRPETEELVDFIISDVKNLEFKTKKLQLLDIGTGSGCIAVSLAKNIENSQVFAIDVSENALEIATKNATINEVEVTFIIQDILKISGLKEITNHNSQPETRNSKPKTRITQPETRNLKFDIIVSNPPYVRNLEKLEIKENVLKYEPHLALFVADDDALLFYRKIAQLAKEHLSENGKLYFEVNQYLGLETVQLLKDMGFKDVILKQDIYGNDRMVRGTF